MNVKGQLFTHNHTYTLHIELLPILLSGESDYKSDGVVQCHSICQCRSSDWNCLSCARIWLRYSPDCCHSMQLHHEWAMASCSSTGTGIAASHWWSWRKRSRLQGQVCKLILATDAGQAEKQFSWVTCVHPLTSSQVQRGGQCGRRGALFRTATIHAQHAV